MLSLYSAPAFARAAAKDSTKWQEKLHYCHEWGKNVSNRCHARGSDSPGATAASGNLAMEETIDLGAGGGGVLDDVIVDTLCLLVSTGDIARPLVSDDLVDACTGIGGVCTVGISAGSPRFASFAHAEARIF